MPEGVSSTGSQQTDGGGCGKRHVLQHVVALNTGYTETLQTGSVGTTVVRQRFNASSVHAVKAGGRWNLHVSQQWSESREGDTLAGHVVNPLTVPPQDLEMTDEEHAACRPSDALILTGEKRPRSKTGKTNGINTVSSWINRVF